MSSAVFKSFEQLWQFANLLLLQNCFSKVTHQTNVPKKIESSLLVADGMGITHY